MYGEGIGIVPKYFETAQESFANLGLRPKPDQCLLSLYCLLIIKGKKILKMHWITLCGNWSCLQIVFLWTGMQGKNVKALPFCLPDI